jgi:pimeloyl-ACP methyl ester carboxylesterase
MRPPFAGQIETAAGTAFVEIMGQGPKVFVVHGGPGFDHRYLRAALLPLARRRTLVFFDQPGCGRTAAPSAGADGGATVALFAALRRELGADAPHGVLAHSWGALVAIAAAPAGAPFAEGLLVTPMPLALAGFQQCQANLFARVPEETQAAFQHAVASGMDGDAIAQLLLPFYLADRRVPVPGLHFNMATFQAVMASLAAFDFSAALPAAGRFDVLLGEADFTTADLVADVLAAAARVDRLPAVGHFPFCEDPAAFAASLARSFP